MRARIGLCALVAATWMSVARPAGAQYVEEEPDPTPFSRRHFYMGARLSGVSVVGQSGPRAFLTGGGGFDVHLGGRLSRLVAIEGAWQPTFHNEDSDYYSRASAFGLSAFTFDLKLIATEGRVQPYAAFGLGYYMLSDRGGPFADGAGFQLGAGLDLWLASWVSLGGRLQYRGVSLSDMELGYDDTRLGLLYFDADLTIHF